jgi:hypothetical protein
VFQDDLYPAIATADPAENASLWLKEKVSVEPVMIDFLTLKEFSFNNQESAESSARSSLRNSMHQSKRMRSRAASILSPGTPTRLSLAGSPERIPGMRRPSNLISPTSPFMDTNVSTVVYLDGFASIERKGWFSNAYDPHYLSLKKTRLYVFQDSGGLIYV